MIVVGFSQETNRHALEMAQAAEGRWCTLGIHPCDVNELTDEEVEWIEQAAGDPENKVLAIGETGLDYHHMSHSKLAQRAAFLRQIEMAKKLDLPLIVHSRDAAEDTLSLLEEAGAEKVIFHCYSYDVAFGKRVWNKGYYTSFSGILTYPQAKSIQEAAQHAPEELILIETDCPYLAPQSIRGKRNEMAYVAEVGETLAQLRGIAPQQLSEQLRENTHRIFGLSKARFNID